MMRVRLMSRDPAHAARAVFMYRGDYVTRLTFLHYPAVDWVLGEFRK